jgi:uncharacterized protein (DUF1697 family)
MTKYVALLRGVNIGGNNKIEMVRLKESFLSLGFLNVSTYLNSGNVIFSDKSKNIKKITEKIEEEILNQFKLRIKVLVRDINNLQQVLDSIPKSWRMDSDKQIHVAFLLSDIDSPNILDQINIDIKANQIKYIQGAIIWNVELKNWSKDAVYKFTNGKISKYVTVRSINTVGKLNELMK